MLAFDPFFFAFYPSRGGSSDDRYENNTLDCRSCKSQSAGSALPKALHHSFETKESLQRQTTDLMKNVRRGLEIHVLSTHSLFANVEQYGV